MANSLHEISLSALRKDDLDPNPIVQFEKWFNEARATMLDLAHMMTLATATKDGCPSARTMVLRAFDERGFVFYTNYESQKGGELAQNPRAALLFYWDELGRQIRITGRVTKVSRENSECYFRSRPAGNRLSALASAQSRVIPNRKVLEDKVQELATAYPDQAIPLPAAWGGYRLSAQMIEFWQGNPSRLHDRFRYARRPDGEWQIERLAP